jgi:uncharacterized protein (UPF0332 family)
MDLGEAGNTLDDAEHLWEQDRLAAAANRIYYAIFQAMVARLEGLGVRPESFRIDQHKWSHATVCSRGAVMRAFNDQRVGEHVQTLQRARELRELVDYNNAHAARLEPEELALGLKRAQELYEDLVAESATPPSEEE